MGGLPAKIKCTDVPPFSKTSQVATIDFFKAGCTLRPPNRLASNISPALKSEAGVLISSDGLQTAALKILVRASQTCEFDALLLSRSSCNCRKPSSVGGICSALTPIDRPVFRNITCLAQVEVDEVLRLVGNIGPKVAAHNAVPGCAVLLVELLLDEGGNVLRVERHTRPREQIATRLCHVTSRRRSEERRVVHRGCEKRT